MLAALGAEPVGVPLAFAALGTEPGLAVVLAAAAPEPVELFAAEPGPATAGEPWLAAGSCAPALAGALPLACAAGSGGTIVTISG